MQQQVAVQFNLDSVTQYAVYCSLYTHRYAWQWSSSTTRLTNSIVNARLRPAKSGRGSAEQVAHSRDNRYVLQQRCYQSAVRA